MSYQVERDTFISQATMEGLSVEVARKLLRYATTLQRLSEAQCNGDWPYNGDRDRPSKDYRTCEECSGTGKRVDFNAYHQARSEADARFENGMADDSMPVNAEDFTVECFTCQSTGKLTTNERERMRHDSRYTTCPKCEAHQRKGGRR